MAIEIKMPQLGESITEGTVSRWLKQVGEPIEKYETLFEVETDKVNTEVPAPAAGSLQKILVAEGECVPVGTVLALLQDEAAGAEAAPVTSQSPALARQAASAPSGVISARPADKTGRRLSPVVARMVVEHKLDISRIPGTGLNGRVSKQDVLRFLERQQEETVTPPPVAAPASRPAPVKAEEPAPEVASARPAPDLPGEEVELVPLTGIRRAIAGHMVRSMQVAPQATTVFEVDLSRVVAHRQQQQASFEQQGVRLTYTPYFCQAVVAGLQAVPFLNGRYTDEGIMLNRWINLGLAVALSEGLIVPVIPQADEKSLLGLARAVNDLAGRARAGQLRPGETQGGTFTITNHGINGSLFSTPILHQPQGGILGIGAIVKRPVVVTYEGQDLVAIKPMCYLSLTYDHRLVDGATADAFMGVVKNYLEQVS